MFSKELVGASTIPIILSILQKGDSYGYAIIKEVDLLTNGKLDWSEPMLYPVLKRMERQGLLQSSWQIVESGRKRKYYSITDLGKSELHSKQQEWQELVTVMSNFWDLKTT